MERIATATNAARRPKWQYPAPPPTPRILQIPRRHRKRPTAKTTPTKPMLQKDRKGKLEALFDQERSFSRERLAAFRVPVVLMKSQEEELRRERVEENGGGGGLVMEEEKWRFQAEMLRAECNLLRMEKEIAVKKMERRRVHMEKAVKSAVQTLLSGKKKIYEGKNASLVFEEEVQALVEKLEKLQRRSGSGVKGLELRKCSNFDKQASFLQRRLEKFGRTSDEVCVKEIQEMAEASLSIKTSCHVDDSFVPNSNCNVEILRRKMEGYSKGVLLERMEEEYESMLSTASNSATSSASTSKRIEYPDTLLPSVQQTLKDTIAYEKNVCSGRCKAIVRKIVEQVRAETEQWSQMQEMLGQVRDEMEELQASRDIWEDRALDSDHQIQSLRSAVQEWRQKALSSESKANELQAQVSELCAELQRLKKEQAREAVRAKNSPPLPQDTPNETEKRVLVCHVKENNRTNGEGHKQKEVLNDRRRKVHTCSSGVVVSKRSPLGDIGNLSALMKQNSKAVFPLQCPYKEDNF